MSLRSTRMDQKLRNSSSVFMILAILLVVCVNAGRETNLLYAAVAHMEPLVEIELRLYEITRSYLMEQKSRKTLLLPFVLQVEEAMKWCEQNAEGYIGNPINSYLMIKRFVYDWRALPSRTDLDPKVGKDINDVLGVNDMYLPAESTDVPGAALGILRLQRTYNFKARDIADGNMPGTKAPAHKLSAQDCIAISDTAISNQFYVEVKEWIEQADWLLDNAPSLRHGNTTKWSIYEYLSYVAYLSGDLVTALNYTRAVLRDMPDHASALENEYIYSWYVEHKEYVWDNPQLQYYDTAEYNLQVYQNNTFVQTCRGARNGMQVKKLSNIWSLNSFYRYDHPLFVLKPLRVTRYHDNPEILLFHDVISDADIDELRYLADPRLTPAQVVDTGTNEIRTHDYRVSKRVFLERQVFEDEKAIGDKLDPYMEAISNLHLGHVTEDFQINNYGLGGQYEFHHDYGEPGTVIANAPNGNRLATLLIYLSNVESGGETIFTQLNLSIPPARGSVVFWYNLHLNGTGVYDTRHASCPVIAGSKWVANRWIHQVGNEVRRPCSLNRFE